MTTKPVPPPTPELLPSHHLESDDLRSINREIGGVLDFLAVVQGVDTEGVAPFDVADITPFDAPAKTDDPKKAQE